jgi:hypothetical protein
MTVPPLVSSATVVPFGRALVAAFRSRVDSATRKRCRGGSTAVKELRGKAIRDRVAGGVRALQHLKT